MRPSYRLTALWAQQQARLVPYETLGGDDHAWLAEAKTAQTELLHQPSATGTANYVALTALKVGDSYRQPADFVPEAAEWGWSIRQQYIDSDRIAPVPAIWEPEATGAA